MANIISLTQKCSSLLLTGILFVSLTACGGGGDTNTSPDNSETQTTASGRLATVKSRGSLICGVNDI